MGAAARAADASIPGPGIGPGSGPGPGPGPGPGEVVVAGPGRCVIVSASCRILRRPTRSRDSAATLKRGGRLAAGCITFMNSGDDPWPCPHRPFG
ncbi:hypothetical protein EVC62_02485 [Salinicola endophyticus]|uniref:Uncharacterized protein n=1 Tax=Salinicola endophyticus TaxID=1949083 RepID=A0ABY8FCB1_9GAMM|nr:hypothetical protein EVC62_02485 [Salinicola endophyticus]